MRVALELLQAVTKAFPLGDLGGDHTLRAAGGLILSLRLGTTFRDFFLSEEDFSRPVADIVAEIQALLEAVS